MTKQTRMAPLMTTPTMIDVTTRGRRNMRRSKRHSLPILAMVRWRMGLREHGERTKGNENAKEGNKD